MDSGTQVRTSSHGFDVKWCGFGFAQCVMWPGELRDPLVFGDTYKELGRPELIADKVHKYRILKEKYGQYRLLEEGPPGELSAFVFDNQAEAIKTFSRNVLDLLDKDEGLDEALVYLQAQRIELEVVSKTRKSRGPGGVEFVVKFLKSRDLDKYFKRLVTPQGRIDLEDDTVDLRYNGRFERDGTVFDTLIRELLEKGVKAHEAVIVGAMPDSDINLAHERGVKTIQYTGFVDFGQSRADTVISSFRELKRILRKKE